jgi:methyl coenzyme M reductase gamma subunit
MLSIHKYYKHGTTDDVLNHIWCIYREDGVYYEDDTHIMGVHHRVSKEIDHVRWREHINQDHVHKIHMPEDGHKYLWKQGCGQW